jgi:hypothetical protein
MDHHFVSSNIDSAGSANYENLSRGPSGLSHLVRLETLAIMWKETANFGRHALFFLVSLSLGCVDLARPWEGIADSGADAATLVDDAGHHDNGDFGPGLADTHGTDGTPASDGAVGGGPGAGGTYGGTGGMPSPGGAGGSAGSGGSSVVDAPLPTDQAQADAGSGAAASDARLEDAADGPRADTEGGDVRDTASLDAPCPLCSLGAALVHRYSFGGTGTKVADSVGTADGTVVNAQLSGSGTLALVGGGASQYVDLPDHLLSTLTDATLEVWVTWSGGNNNQRILDFGSNSTVNGRTQATTTIIISPNSAPQGTPPRLRASYSNQVSSGSTFADAPSTLQTGTKSHIVAVFDGQQHTLSLYLNGVSQGQATGLSALSLISDVNNWLGRSQYTDDPGFSGTYDEFRIFDAALTVDQIQASYTAGPDALFRP